MGRLSGWSLEISVCSFSTRQSAAITQKKFWHRLMAKIAVATDATGATDAMDAMNDHKIRFHSISRNTQTSII